MFLIINLKDFKKLLKKLLPTFSLTLIIVLCGILYNNFNTSSLPVSVQSSKSQPTAYLTFDDGPSPTTQLVLQVLEDKNIKASFFVISADNNIKYLPLVKEINDAGHYIALHSASHDYSKIYANTEAYWQDLDELWDNLSEYIDIKPHIIRFPGGSTNTISHKYGGSDIMKILRNEAPQKGYFYLDWNVCADDATGTNPSPEKIVQNILNDAKKVKGDIIILLHDTSNNKNSAKALPMIIDELSKKGYTFDTVDKIFNE